MDAALLTGAGEQPGASLCSLGASCSPRGEDNSKEPSRKAGDQLKALEGEPSSHHPQPKINTSPQGYNFPATGCSQPSSWMLLLHLLWCLLKAPSE